MSTTRADMQATAHELSREFSQRLAETKVVMQDGFRALKAAMGDLHRFSSRVMHASFRDGARKTIVEYDTNDDIQYSHSEPETLSDIAQTTSGKVGIAFLSIPVILPSAFLSVTLVPLFINSVRSQYRTFLKVVNLPRYDLLSDEKRKYVYRPDGLEGPVKTIYGSPGYILGIALAAPIALSMLLARFFTNNITAIGQAWWFVVRKSMNKPIENSIFDVKNHKTSENVWRLGVGLLGVGIGLVTGAISGGVVFISRHVGFFLKWNAVSFGRTFKRVINPFLATGDELKLAERNRSAAQKGAGFLGAGAGAVVGGLADLFIFLGRFVSNTIKGFGQSWIWAVRFGFKDKSEFKGDNIVRLNLSAADKKWRRYVGSLGCGLGFVTGFISAAVVFIARQLGHFMKQNGISFGRTFKRVINPFLATGDELKLAERNRSAAQKGAGFLGAGAGAVVGGIADLFIFLGRFVTNTVKAFGQVWLWSARFGLKNRNKLKGKDISQLDHLSAVDKNLWRYGIGSIGGFVGLLTGLTSAGVIFATRHFGHFMKQNGISFGRTFKRVINPFLATGDELKLAERNRSAAQKGAGFLGAGAGAVVGGIADLFIFLGRFVTNTVKAFGQVWLWSARFGLKNRNKLKGKDISQLDHLSAVDKNLWRYGIGSIGGFVGLLTGLTSAGVIFATRHFGHFMKQNGISFGRTFKRVINPFLATGDELKLAERNRSAAQKGAGFLGAGAGAVVGGLADLFIFLGRFVSNTIKGFGQSWIWAVRFGFKDKSEFKGDNIVRLNLSAADKKWRRYVGSLGCGLGFVTGFISAGVVLAARGIGHFMKQSGISFGRIFKRMTNPLLPTGEENLLTKRKRTKAQRGFGVAGLVLGAVAGGLADLFIFLGRLVSNTMKAFGQVWLWSARFGLKNRNELKGKDISQLDHLSAVDKKFWRCSVGSVGGFLGLITGFATAGIILIARGSAFALKNTLRNFKFLSGAMMNVALGREHFKAFNADERSGLAKGVGTFGYLAATLTTGVVSAFIFTLRKAIPMLGSAVMFATSPVVLLFKMMALPFAACDKGVRFKHDFEDDDTTQRIRNLYSALSAMGRLPGENQSEAGKFVIAENDGGVTAKQFFGKSVKFNLSSTSERLVNLILKHYKENANLDKAINAAKEEVLKPYQGKESFLNDAGTMQNIRNNIERVVKAVSGYLHTGEYQIDAKPSSTITRYKQLFFGRLPTIASQAISSESTTESMELDSSSSSYSSGY